MVVKVSEQINGQNNSAYINKFWGDAMYNAPIYNVTPGGTNVTFTLQALIDRAISEGRRAIYFPAGEYYVTALENDDQVDFFGDNATFVGGYAGTIRQMGAWATNEQLADITYETGYGIISGGKVTEQLVPDMSVRVEAMNVNTIDGSRYAIDDTNVPISPSSPTLRRRDLIAVTNSGEIEITEGTPSTEGEPPEIPSNVVPLAIVTVKEGVTAIARNQILDIRVFKLSSNDLQTDIQVAKNNNAISNRASEGTISALMDYAQSYVKNRNLFNYGERDAFRDGDIYQDGNGHFEMTCSTFCHLMVKGIPFENSKYNGLSENVIGLNFNNDYEVTPSFVTFRWAEWAYNNGYLFEPREDFSNLQPGDMLMIRFRKSENQLVNRDMAWHLIEHSAMFVENRKTGLMVYEQGGDDGPVFRTYTPELLADTFDIAYVCRMPYTSVDWHKNNLLIYGNEPKDINGNFLIGVYDLVNPLKSHKWYTVVVKGILETPNTYLSFYSGSVVLYSTVNDYMPENGFYVYHFCTRDTDLSANNFRVLLASDGSVPDNERYANIEWVVLAEGFVNSINEYIDTHQKVVFTLTNGFTGYHNIYYGDGFAQLTVRITNPATLIDGISNVGTITGSKFTNSMSVPCNVVQQLTESPSYAKDITAWIDTSQSPYRLRLRRGTVTTNQFVDISVIIPV